jgi:hypothetical protein
VSKLSKAFLDRTPIGQAVQISFSSKLNLCAAITKPSGEKIIANLIRDLYQEYIRHRLALACMTP